MDKCLIVVDFQNDFVDGSLGTAEAQALTEKVADKIARRRAEGWNIIFTLDTHTDDYLETSEGRHLPVVHCVRGTSGHDLASAAKNNRSETDIVIEKPTFGSQQLYEILEKEQPSEIELIGLVTDICVISNAVIAKTACPESSVRVDAECCAGTTPENHAAAVQVMTSLQVDVDNA